MDAPDAHGAAPAAQRPRARRAALAGLLGMLALAAALLAGAAWTLRSERGSAWLLTLLPGVQVEAPRGALLGDFAAARVTVHLPGGAGTVVLAQLAWRGLHIERGPAPLWLTLAIDTLDIRRVDLALAPGSQAPSAGPPARLALPIGLDLRALRIGELHAKALGERPVRDIAAHIQLGANQGAEHRIDALTLSWDRLRLSGEARIASTAPLALAASIALAQDASGPQPAWHANATLTGPLEAPQLKATLRAAAQRAPGAEGAPQTLDLRATLHPFAAWPLGDLQAEAKALDLSALGSGLPVTALTLHAVATSTAADRPARVTIALENEGAGRWDEGGLPLRRLALDLAARPDQPDELTLHSLDAELGSRRAAAGRLTGAGRWSPRGWRLDATLAAVQPSGLDGRAPAMPLSGPLTLSGANGSLDAVEVRTALTGTLAAGGARRAAALTLDAGVAPGRVELRALTASVGGARATAQGRLEQAAPDAPWSAKAQVALVDFDPAVWWPGPDGSAWRRAGNRLNAQGTLELSLPAQAAQQPWRTTLAALRGRVGVRLGRSLLAGVPLSGEASLGRAAGPQAQARLRLDADGNTLRADGRLDTAGSGSADVWDLSLDGPALGRLAPVLQLFHGGDATLAGRFSAQAHVTGRWPAVSTQGRIEADDLRVGTLAVHKAQASWGLGTAAGAATQALLTLERASLAQGGTPGPSLETLRLQLSGTALAHTLALRAESKARPPAWAESMQGGPAPSGAARTIALLQARGGLVEGAGVPTGWRGTLRQLDLRSDTPAALPWLHAQDVALEALWAGAAAQLTVQPGRAELLGGGLRWRRIAWRGADRPGAFAQVEADVEIEPLRIAPLLARAQPEFGWGGDLTVAGHLRLHSAPTFGADVVIERRGGDLNVTDELGTRALGLTDVRLGLVADNGTWSFTQGLAGQALGVVAGAEVVRTSPQASWPTADAPLEGVLELRVDDLGSWGGWVPPGWRLGGALHTSASFGGRFGAPEYTGQIEGTRLSVRNFLQGVNVREGDLAIQLLGRTARIERFSARAGDGRLDLAGDATLGETPTARLTLRADRFQLLSRVDRRIVASGTGQLSIDRQTLAFDGRFGVDEGLIDFTRGDAPALSSDVLVVRAADAPPPAAAASAAASPDEAAGPSAAPPRDVALDLHVDLGQKLRVRGRGLDARLRGKLQITSPGGRLAVNGTVRAVDGTYAAYGQKLSIDRGLITFTGAVDSPRLDIEATRPNLDVRVGVSITGRPANPRIRLFSDPEMADIDKLSWLVMGRASDGLGRTDTALLQRTALALLAGEGGGPTDQLTKALGLDDISLRQTEGEVRETVIALGKQLSKRWYVGYERGLNATAGSLQLVYRIARRFTLRAQSGDDNSLDLIWTWRWH
jgi:translocation and assembly module TamB